MKDIPATYSTTIRADIRDLATVAKFFALNNFVLPSQTKGILALHAYRMLGDHIRKIDSKYGVEGTEEAVGVLRDLGYGESAVPGRRDYIPLMKQMSKENLEVEGYQNYIKPLTNEQIKEAETYVVARELPKKHTIKPTEIKGVEAILGPDETNPEPEPESKQLKERTPADEAKDIKKLKSAMAIPDGAPLEDLEEITPETSNDD